VCGNTNVCGSHLGGIKCHWCGVKLCSYVCLKNYEKKICDYGKFSLIKLPPTSIYTNGETDIKLWKIRKSFIKHTTPVIVFINKRSGGGLGEVFIRNFVHHLNPIQIFDLGEGGPEPGLNFMFNNKIKNFQILGCGGDGTCAWILSILDKINPEVYPPLGVLPLGTGNDLSRSLGWGPGCDNPKDIKLKVLPALLDKCKVAILDRWNIKITESEDKVKDKVINNYFSIGIDAKVALSFHEKREKNPEMFSSRTVNKMWYAKFGVEGLIDGCPNLQDHLEVELDGKTIELPQLEALVIVNLPSCYGGAYLWSNKADPMGIGDGKFEVVGVTGAAHLGVIQTDLTPPIIIGQGSEIKITLKNSYPVQIDGEPWNQESCTFHITHLNKVRVLVNPNECHEVIKKEIEKGE